LIAVLIAIALLSVGVPQAGAQGTLDQSVAGGPGGVGVNGTLRLAQTFTAGLTGVLSQVGLDLSTRNSPSPLTVDIESIDTSGHLSGTVLAAASLDGSAASGFTTWVTLSLNNGPFVVAGTQYAIVLADPGDNGFPYWVDQFANPNPYTGGHAVLSGDSGSTWQDVPAFSLAFRTYVETLTKEGCKHSGWRDFLPFNNQGQCIAFTQQND
jgi:hypothetical protein